MIRPYRPRRVTLPSVHIGARLSLTLVAFDDERPEPPVFLHLPLLSLTWLVGLLFFLRANITRARREVRWLRRRFLNNCEAFFINIELTRIFGRAVVYGLAGV
jgi:hypothetical protein